jgi:phosphatidylglycerophosphatase A
MSINLLAVFVCTIFTFVLGGIWYSRLLFANLFIKNINKTEEELKKGGTGIIFLYEFVAAFITNYVLASLIILLGTDNFWRGFQLGIIVWIGFVAMTHISTVTFEKRNFTLFLIQIFYRLVAISISGGILAVWK